MSAKLEQQLFKPASSTNFWIYGMIAIGVFTFVVGLLTNVERTWRAFLVNDMLFLGLAIGAVCFLALHNLASAGWLAVARRLPEAFINYLKVGVPLTLVLLFGLKYIYPWTDHEMMHADHFLHHKAAYFGTGFFSIRMVLFFAVLCFFAFRMLKNSLSQDSEGGVDLMHRNRPLSAGFFVLFAPLFTVFTVDVIKSLSPKWFSTIFGVYVFTGFIQTAVAVVIICLFLLKRSRYMDRVKDDHLHDFSKYLFGWSIFWGYIGVSQYLLIWYANLPEETFFYEMREQGSWTIVSLLLPLLKFAIPFILLLPFKAKRSLGYVTGVACIVVISEWVDLTWMIMPTLTPHGFTLAWQDLGLFIGFLGLFSYMVRSFWAKHSMVPLKDPYMHESLHHHVI